MDYLILGALVVVATSCAVLAVVLVVLHLAAYKGPPTYKIVDGEVLPVEEELYVPEEWLQD